VAVGTGGPPLGSEGSSTAVVEGRECVIEVGPIGHDRGEGRYDMI
jgi:hypothetical protein